MLTVNELFSGIGTQALALEYLGIPHKVVGTAEIEKNAIEAYNILHGETRNYGDISKIDKLDYADLWTYSFPCFTGDTLVFTDKGYKKMIDVDTNDQVFTHKSRFRPVVKKFNNGIHEIWELKTANVDVIRTTKNHRFYVVTRTAKRNYKTNKTDYTFSEPYWKECWELTSNDYVLSPTYNVEREFYHKSCSTGSHLKLDSYFNKPDFFWLLGKYVGDGCLGGYRKHRNINNREIIFVTSKKNFEHTILEEKFKKLQIKYTKKEQNTVLRYSVSSVELSNLCRIFNEGALNKRLPIEIFNLKKPLLKAFIEGYLFADGCKVGNHYKITSVSRELLYGVGMCITKVYNIPFRLYKDERPSTCIIEGRTVNQHDTYQLVFDLRTDIRRTSCVYLHNNYWYKITDVKNTFEKELVYDIEVQDDHSLVVQGLSPHNCQDLSSGGKGLGVSAVDAEGNRIATRSGLLWEVERLLARASGYDIIDGVLVVNKEYEKNPPKYLLLENVPELIKSKKHSKNFDKWKDRLDELGYFTVFAVLNGKDFGIPQNRERVFALSIRKDIRNKEDSLALPNADSPFAPPIHRNFDKFVDKSVLEYNGPLMIDPKISNYLLPAYTRDIESIAACSEDPLNRTEIWTCECKSGFQDHRVGIKWAPTIRHQNQHTAIFVNNQIHKLTACECWKFMGIKEKDFWKVKNNSKISDTILCGLAGNAIVVPVLMSIFNQIWQIEQGKEPYGLLEVPFLTVDVKDGM